MKIVDLDEARLEEYLVCLEEWSDEMREAGEHKRRWYQRAKDEGLCVKLALDDAGTAGAMIQYGPIERSFAEGTGLEFVYCIWVHGYKEGRGNYRGRGMGSALLQAAEQDAQRRGALGMAAWGLSLPIWMRASWFRKHGYAKADGMGGQILLWKPFAPSATAPRWIRPKRHPQRCHGKVTVTSFRNGWCPAQNLVHERARRMCAELGDPVVFETIDTSDRTRLLEWGISDALFIDGKAVRTGPPPSYEKLERLVHRRMKRL